MYNTKLILGFFVLMPFLRHDGSTPSPQTPWTFLTNAGTNHDAREEQNYVPQTHSTETPSRMSFHGGDAALPTEYSLDYVEVKLHRHRVFRVKSKIRDRFFYGIPPRHSLRPDKDYNNKI